MARRARICNHPHMERREFLKRGLVGLYGLRTLALPGAPAAAVPIVPAAAPLTSVNYMQIHRGALIASGGLCAPLTPIYEIPSFTTADRPVRDALPS